MKFTAEDALEIIHVTKSGVRPPKASPNSEVLAKDLTDAALDFGAIRGAGNTIRMSSTAFTQDFKKRAQKLEKKTAELIELLEPKGKTLFSSAWEIYLNTLLVTRKMKLPITLEQLNSDDKAIQKFMNEIVGNLLEIQRAASRIKAIKGFMSYQMTPELERAIKVADGIADDKIGEFVLITQILPKLFKKHFKEEFGITHAPKEGGGMKFAKACLNKLKLSISDSTLFEYWHRRDRKGYAKRLQAK